MALAKRIIPCLDVDQGRVVKGVNFVGIRDAGDPVEIARRYNEEGADEITFLDITASHEERDTTVIRWSRLPARCLFRSRSGAAFAHCRIFAPCSMPVPIKSASIRGDSSARTGERCLGALWFAVHCGGD